MANLTEAQLAYLATQLGSTLDEDDLQERYDRLGSVVQVAHEVVALRLADAINDGPGFALAGVYSQQSSADIIKALTAQADRLGVLVAAELAPPATATALTQGRLVRADRGR